MKIYGNFTYFERFEHCSEIIILSQITTRDIKRFVLFGL